MTRALCLLAWLAAGAAAAPVPGPGYHDAMAQLHSDYVPRVKKQKTGNVTIVRSAVARASLPDPLAVALVRSEADKPAMQRWLEERYPKAGSTVETVDEHVARASKAGKLDLKRLRARIKQDLKGRFAAVYLFEPTDVPVYTPRPGADSR